jgi:peptide/nickel transport system permease protein
MFKGRLAKTGAAIVIMFTLVAVFAPALAPYDPNEINLAGELESPSRTHLLGQDKLGRDILSRVIYGSRVSLAVGFSVVGISVIIGIFIGAVSGYKGGVYDIIIMRIIDVLLSFPGILLAIAITGVMGPSLKNVIFALCVFGWVGYARLVRGQVLSIREREYVLSAKALGAKDSYIIIKHILPNTLSPIIVTATFGIAGVILAESSLSFLGLGPQNVPTWGAMLNEGAEYLLFAPHVSIFPGIAIMLTILGFNFIGDGIRDYFDPKNK